MDYLFLNKRQQNAVARLRRMFDDSAARANAVASSEATKQAVEFAVKDSSAGSGAWVSVDIVYPNAKGTLLSAIGSEHWFIAVGERGALTAYSYPKSVEQFAGRQWMGINIKRKGY
jgi:hypothetical protein